MSKMVWDQVGERLYDTGVDQVAFFKFNNTTKQYGVGVPWNGVTGITESPSGAESNAFYADNKKYLDLLSAETFGATITAYDYPDEFESCNGYAEIATGAVIGQQSRDTFALAYRTIIGNDTALNDYGFKIKLVYGCKAAPSEQAHSTVNESPAPTEMSWTISTTPIDVEGFKPTATLDLDSTKIEKAKMDALLDLIYGTAGTVSYTAYSGSTTGKNPVEEGWYERSGSAGSYVYTLSIDTEADSQKTYFVKTETGGTDPMIPLPEKVVEILTAA